MRTSKVLVAALMIFVLSAPSELQAQVSNPPTIFTSGPVRWWNDSSDGYTDSNRLVASDGSLFEVTPDLVTSYSIDDGSTNWANPITSETLGFDTAFIDLVDGQLIVTFNGSLTSYDPIRGEEQWQIQADASPDEEGAPGYGLFSEPSFGNGLIYSTAYASDLGSLALHAYSLETGFLTWRTAVEPLQIYQVPLQDGRLFVSTEDGVTSAIDAISGDVIWQTETNGSGVTEPVATESVVIATMRDEGILGLVGLDLTSGDEVYRMPGAWILDSTADSIAVASSEEGFILADAASGATKWNIPGAFATQAVIGDQVLIDQFTDGIDRLGAYDLVSGAKIWETQGKTASFWPIEETLFRVMDDRVQVLNAVNGDFLYEMPMIIYPTITEVGNDLVAMSGVEGSVIMLDTSRRPATTGEAPLPGISRIDTVEVPDEPELFAGLWQLTVAPFASFDVPSLGDAFAFSIESGEAILQPSGFTSGTQLDRTFLHWFDGQSVSNTGPSPLKIWFAGLVPADLSIATEAGPLGSFELVMGFQLDRPESDRVALMVASHVIGPGVNSQPEVLLMPATLTAKSGEVQFSPGGTLATPGVFTSISYTGTDDSQVATLSLAPSILLGGIGGGGCYGRCLVS